MNLNKNIPQIMALLELPMSVVNPLMDKLQNDPHNAKPELDKFKDVVNRQRRHLAKKYHPDKNGGNAKRMQDINNLIDVLLKSRIQASQASVVVHYYYTYTGFSGGTTTSANYF